MYNIVKWLVPVLLQYSLTHQEYQPSIIATEWIVNNIYYLGYQNKKQ